MRTARILIVLVTMSLLTTAVSAQVDPTAAPKPPPELKTYQGRTIAQTMHYLGAEWLTRDSREKEERTSQVLANLGVEPGMTVVDMGCGNGYYSLKLAKLVGEEQGKVLGVDIQREMLQFLQERMKEAKVTNIKPIHGSLTDPHLPTGEVDLILCVDVYHEFSHPEYMLASMRKSLKPDGLLVLLEYREEDPKVPIKPLHKMSKKQVNKELADPTGFYVLKKSGFA